LSHEIITSPKKLLILKERPLGTQGNRTLLRKQLIKIDSEKDDSVVDHGGYCQGRLAVLALA